MNCENACYEAIIPSCDDIVVQAGLTANTAYYWIMSKPSSSNIYQRLATTDADGTLTILKSDLPAGFLVKGNNYNIQLRNGSDYLQKATLTFGGKAYTCIIASLVNIDRAEDDDSKVNVIK